MKISSLLSSTDTASSSTVLHGGWLLFARIAWLVLVVITLGLFIKGIPLRAKNLQEKYQSKIGAKLIWNRADEIALSPWWDYPAYQAGILEGDILVAINGVSPHLEAGDSLDELIPTGEVSTPITLTVRTGAHPEREYKLFPGGEDPLALAQLGFSPDFIVNYAITVEFVFALICLGIAVMIFMRRSSDWLAMLASLTFMLMLLGVSQYVLALYNDQPAWRPAIDVWFALVLFDLLLFFCVFPDGRFVPHWIRILLVIGALWIVAQGLDPRLYPWKAQSFQKGFAIIAAWLSVGILAQVYRYRYYSNAIQRQQTKWVVLGMTASILGLLGHVYNTAQPGILLPDGLPTVLFELIGYPIVLLLKLLLPLTIAFAILRYRLWDIDILINRTLVYGALTASVIGIYVIVVGTLGTTIQGRSNLLISILATGLVAVLVQPLRDRLQRGVNRMMYGERDDPVTVLSRLGERLEGTLAPDAVLPSLVETVAQTLKLPYVAIETTNHRLDSQPTPDSVSENVSAPTIAYGHPVAEVIRFPLIYQSETIGQLAVAPRGPGEALSPMDRHLLQNIAHQAGMAVHAVSLTADLQRSRQRLVTAREEERRRLRRDLHDGLGPNLASQGLKLAAVKELLLSDPASVAPLLDQVMAQNKSTVEEVRRLVYGLRPPALDELGLVAAIRDHLSGMGGSSNLQIEITEPEGGLPPLSAAVEVAAYRIALEALTNVIRHAQAKHCTIRFSLAQQSSGALLQIEIVDDGIGLPRELHAGVGLRSMRERAEELDGKLIVESQPNVTRVLAILPFGETGVQANLSTQTQRVDSKQIANLGLEST